MIPETILTKQSMRLSWGSGPGQTDRVTRVNKRGSSYRQPGFHLDRPTIGILEEVSGECRKKGGRFWTLDEPPPGGVTSEFVVPPIAAPLYPCRGREPLQTQ